MGFPRRCSLWLLPKVCPTVSADKCGRHDLTTASTESFTADHFEYIARGRGVPELSRGAQGGRSGESGRGAGKRTPPVNRLRKRMWSERPSPGVSRRGAIGRRSGRSWQWNG